MGKAVMYTITFFLLGSVLLAMSFLLFEISQSTEKRATEIAVNNRVHDLSTSISKSMADIFILDSGINITITNNTINIVEFLPNANLDNYTERVENFTSFVDNRENYVAFDLDDLDETRLLITPPNSVFYNDNVVDRRGDEPIRYITNFVNVENITFHIHGSAIEPLRIEWQEFIEGPTRVTAIFENDTTRLEETRFADLVGDGRGAEFRVTFVMNNSFDGDDMDFEVRDGDLFKALDLKYNTTVNITYTYTDEDQLQVFMNNPITVNIPEFNVTKITFPRIV